MQNVNIFEFDANGKLDQQRLSDIATLDISPTGQNSWNLEQSEIYTPLQKKQLIQKDSIPTILDASNVRSQFGDPNSLPIWALIGAVFDVSQSTSVRPDVHMRFYSLIAMPIFLVSTLMVAIVFTMGYRRQGVSRFNVLMSILVGFAIYVFIRVAEDSGDSGLISAPIAAFGPALLILVVCTTVLLFLEDG